MYAVTQMMEMKPSLQSVGDDYLKLTILFSFLFFNNWNHYFQIFASHKTFSLEKYGQNFKAKSPAGTDFSALSFRSQRTHSGQNHFGPSKLRPYTKPKDNYCWCFLAFCVISTTVQAFLRSQLLSLHRDLL